MNTIIIYVLSAAAAGCFIGYFIGNVLEKTKGKRKRNAAQAVLDEAVHKSDDIKRKAELDARDLLYKLRVDFDKQTVQQREDLQRIEKKIASREENLEKRLDFIESKERDSLKKESAINALKASLESKERQLNQLVEEEKDKLQKISSLTAKEAREILLSRFEEEIRDEKAVMFKTMEDEIKEEADKKAREIISLAIQRCAVEYTTESTVSVVQLPNDEMKGRVIGREGRNIRAFETATGVDLVIDDTPEAVAISSFDAIRREVARLSLETLVSDGRIHPTRIEEVVSKVQKEFDKRLLEEGKNAAFEIGIHNLNQEIIRLLGKLKYRTSFGQNALQHSKEVAFIMGILAAELGLDARIAKRAGLLHDVGKAVDHQVEGTHSKIGAELLRKYGENDLVVNVAEAHHEEAEFKSIYGVLSIVADAVSASRPGARRETVETYIKRLRELENIADSFPGVEKSYAIQAGREIRVIISPSKTKEDQVSLLAYQIKKKIEEEMEYPGQIKITAVREVRHVEYAK